MLPAIHLNPTENLMSQVYPLIDEAVIHHGLDILEITETQWYILADWIQERDEGLSVNLRALLDGDIESQCDCSPRGTVCVKLSLRVYEDSK